MSTQGNFDPEFEQRLAARLLDVLIRAGLILAMDYETGGALRTYGRERLRLRAAGQSLQCVARSHGVHRPRRFP